MNYSMINLDDLMPLALKSIENKGWASFNLLGFSKENAIDLFELSHLIPNKNALIEILLTWLESQLLFDIDKGLVSLEDQVFESIMHRLEALEPFKGALKEISIYICQNPLDHVSLIQPWLKHLHIYFKYTLEAQGPAPLSAMGFYLKILPIWLDDDPTLSKTMAALDHTLKEYLPFVASFSSKAS